MLIEKINILRLITYKYIFIISTDRGEMVNNIIRDKYSASQVEAIVNNYLSDTTNEEYLKEFNDMQEWRKKTKSIAKKVNDFIKENDLINKPDGVYEIKD